MKKIAAFLFQFFMITAAFAGPLDELDRFIEQARLDWDVPGVSVVVVQDGQVVMSKGYGVRQAGTKGEVDANTIFQLASVTKPFTSAAIGIQVDQKKLTWDDEIIRHLPQFALKDPYPSRYATARDLLAHRTGLGAFEGDLLGKLGYSNEEILRRIRFIKPATSFRNRAYYSNVGYFAAGELLGAITNSSWEDAVRTTLIVPLDMNRTGFAENLTLKNVAHGHILEDGKAKVVPWDETGGFPAAGAMTSTASDMGNWMEMLLNKGSYGGKQVLNPETVQEMFASSMAAELSFSELPPIDQYSGFDFGLGWGNYHYQGKMIVEKGGGLDGIRTLVTMVPQMGLGITILANLNFTFLPEAIRAEFLQLFVGKSKQDFQEIIKAKALEVGKMLQPPPKPEHVLPASRPLEDYTGTFVNELYGKFKVVLENGELELHAGPAPFRGTLKHFSLDTFLLSWPVVNSGNEEVTFIFGPEGQAKELQTETLGRFQVAPQKSS